MNFFKSITFSTDPKKMRIMSRSLASVGAAKRSKLSMSLFSALSDKVNEVSWSKVVVLW